MLFSLALGTIILKDMTHQKMALVAFAGLFPDLDILWHHRSELHSPLVLLVFALLLAIQNRSLFTPLLLGFWSHSALDIFLFDNSNHTIKNLANQVVGNDSIAQHIEDNIMRYTSADGIMLFYPFSAEKFSIILGEESYAIMAIFIMVMAILSFLGLYFKESCSKLECHSKKL